MVVWLSCYAFVPVVFLMAYDRAKRIFNNCCKKKNGAKKNENITKEERDKLNKEINQIDENSKAKNEWIFYDSQLNK